MTFHWVQDKGLKIPVMGSARVKADGRNIAPAVDAFALAEIDLAAQRISRIDQRVEVEDRPSDPDNRPEIGEPHDRPAIVDSEGVALLPR